MGPSCPRLEPPMEKLPLDLDGPDPRRGLSTMSRGLVGSEILRIAAEIRAAVTAGQKIANFTVGDFSSREFPIPDRLRDGTLKALAAGETNYPPSDGVLRLREAVREVWRDRLHPRGPPGERGDRRRISLGHLCHVPCADRAWGHGGVPGAELEQQPLLPPGGREGRAAGDGSPARVLAHGRVAPARPAQGAVDRAEHSAQPGWDGALP